jgi:hypothetical protein
MSFIRSRLRRLEDRCDSEGCPECRLKPEVPLVFYPDQDDHPPEPERCPRCSRLLGCVIRVEYEEEGEGGTAVERTMPGN